jgi:CheY-like chemotaxis protein
MEPGNILVVDDNAINRAKMRMAVRSLGHRAEVAEDGAVALKRLREESFDAVLLDIMMPEMDGYDVLSELAADEDLRDVPVIVVSSLDDDTDNVVRAIELAR